MENYYITHAEINLNALRSNYEKIKAMAGDTPVMCVVKADAYGHGAERCSALLYDEGCRNFAVATVSEALEIKNTLPGSNVLILGVVPESAASILADNGIIITLPSIDYARRISAANMSKKALRCHVKLDTGMNRLGFPCTDGGIDDIQTAVSLNGLCAEGIFTHFATSDSSDRTMTTTQLSKYISVTDELASRGITFTCRHVSNSAAILSLPEARFDMVRAGIILYGLRPSDEVYSDELTPVMTLKTAVTHVHTLSPGDTVGYGATYTAVNPTEVATLPIGYDDGFIRAYANGGYVLINGKKAPIIGRICMDQCMVNVTGLGINYGDEVEIFGTNNPISVFSSAAATIPYEIVCLISKRVPRIYV